MPEFNFFGSWKDAISILEQLLDTNQFRIIADIPYKKPIAYEVASVSDDTLSVIKQHRHILLLSENYSLYPIKFHEPKHGYTGIRLLESGPLIDMILPDIYENDGKQRVGNGSISYPPYFFIPNEDKSYIPPQELKVAFKSVKKLIQKNMNLRYWFWNKQATEASNNPSIESVWIGKNALDLMEKKGYLIKWGRDIWIAASDLHKDRLDI